MIRKILATFLAVCSICLLCSCSDYREIERGYLVTALCFSGEGQGLTVSLETLVSTAYGSDMPQTQILTASGQNANITVQNLELTLTKELYFDHCAVLIVENDLSREQLSDIISYCNTNKRLNKGLYVVMTENIDAVLETKSVSGAVGYDIMNLMKKLKEKNKTDYNNRLYEVERSILQSFSKPSLPLLKLAGGRVEV